MKEFALTDVQAQELDALGLSKPQWILEQLRAKGFDLTRPVRYRYDAVLQRTRMYQYEWAPDLSTDQRDFDADLSSDEDWDRALDLLEQDPVPLARELATSDDYDPWAI